MKKLFIIILLFASAALFAKSQKSDPLVLTFDLIDYIESYQTILEIKEYATEFMALSDFGKVFPRSRSRIAINLEQGTQYVFYTVTDGPKVAVCCALPNSAIGDNLYSEESDKIIYHIAPQYTGTYYFYIVSRDNEQTGMHITCFTKLYKKEKVKEQVKTTL